jgi:hypothetical protein
MHVCRWMVCTSLAGLSMAIERAVLEVRLRTSRHQEMAASDAVSTPIRRTAGRSTGAAATGGSSPVGTSAAGAARTSARRTTAIPQAARSADAICPAGTDAAALELLCGFVKVLSMEEHEADKDATGEALGLLMEAVLDTIDVIEGHA